jgi:hypothetical protein
MTEIPQAITNEPTRPCKICAEPIKIAARKCIHCDSYQDWRSKINFSSTVLSLVVALVSVLTVAVPVVIQTLTPKDSNLKFQIAGASEDTLSILVTNSGTRPGFVRQFADLTARYGATELKTRLLIRGKDKGGGHLLEPGKSEVLEFYYSANPDDKPLHSGTYMVGHCTLLILYTNFADDEFADSAWKPEMVCGEMWYFIQKMEKETAKNLQVAK